ncbi:MAG: hypothetical protein LBR19_05675, partial [Bifidobacteriaceae bacterium]|nr:hypothetical protein [Bifidobacteriaceae bacterium]
LSWWAPTLKQEAQWLARLRLVEAAAAELTRGGSAAGQGAAVPAAQPDPLTQAQPAGFEVQSTAAAAGDHDLHKPTAPATAPVSQPEVPA